MVRRGPSKDPLVAHYTASKLSQNSFLFRSCSFFP